MNQVHFGSVGSYSDLGMILTDVNIDAPEPKRELEDIPGMDGVLDVSYEATGDMKFNNRNLTFDFAMIDYSKNWEDRFSEIINAIHGKNMDIYLDPNTDWYWEAFCTVEEPKTERNKATIRVVCDAYPYKKRKEETTYVITLGTSSKKIACKNSRMKVMPKFIATGSCTLRSGNSVKSITAGTYEFADIIFGEGDNDITVSGSGTLTVKYREGKLR